MRWLAGGIPDSGVMTFAGWTYTLESYETTNGLIAVTDSKQIGVDPADTLAGNTADITVCAGGECDNRVYRTVA